MAFDIDSRDFAELEDNSGDWIPRADARYRTKLVFLEEVEKDSWAGWIATVLVNGVEEGKKHEVFDPPAVKGREYKTIFKRIGHKYPDQKNRDMFALRQLVAAATGQEHTPELKVGQLLATLCADGANYAVLPEFSTIVRCTPSKPAKATKADGSPNPNVGKVYANSNISFEI